MAVTMISRITLNVRKAWYTDILKEAFLSEAQTRTIAFRPHTTLHFAVREDTNLNIPLKELLPIRSPPQDSPVESNGLSASSATN